MHSSYDSKCVIVGLYGGLGNQMFQYACGLAVSHANGLPLKGDISYFKRYKAIQLRSYELDKYMLNLELANPGEISRLIKSKYYPLLSRFIPGRRFFYLKEKRNHSFDPLLLSGIKTNQSIYLDGYWQSYRYFDHLKKELSADFRLRTELGRESQEILDKIRNSNSVAVHIRRGDYAENPQITSYHGLCSLDYYASAISYLNGQLTNPQYFIFSDDQGWCRDHLKINGSHEYIKPVDDNAAVDMYLMSHCKNFIIANSSFSWWGAWLCSSNHKIVIYPKRWLVNTENLCLEDFIPEDWIGM